ncbi:hypothetical protein HY970_03375 [Candidatus Kaiserbacteria bacterium]|nr:hypothetical protein [Candidatus Kaiserbacteria bacterium]
MNANITLQIACALLFAAIAVLLVNPYELWMPSKAYMVILAAAVVVFGLFSVFILAEKAGDERDHEHRGFAGRVAFLLGGAILLAGIIVQTLAHDLDPWLVAALTGMVVGKTLARWYSATFK